MASSGGKNFRKISGLTSYVQVHRFVHVGVGEEALEGEFGPSQYLTWFAEKMLLYTSFCQALLVYDMCWKESIHASCVIALLSEKFMSMVDWWCTMSGASVGPGHHNYQNVKYFSGISPIDGDDVPLHHHDLPPHGRRQEWSYDRPDHSELCWGQH